MFAFASVIVSVVLDGVSVAPEEEPVITFVPLNAVLLPLESAPTIFLPGSAVSNSLIDLPFILINYLNLSISSALT